MKIIIAVFIIFGLLLIFFPELVGILIGIFLIIIGFSFLMIYLFIRKNQNKGKMSDDDFIQVGKYKININKDKK